METNFQEITLLNENTEIANGSQTIVMEGQYFIPSNSQTILVSGNETQYLIQNAGDIFGYSDETLSINQNEVYNLVDSAGEVIDGNQIVYYTSDSNILPSSGLTFMDVIDASEKQDETEFIDLESLLSMKIENQWTDDNDTNGYQYIVQLQNLNSIDPLPDDKFGSILDHSYNSREIDVNLQETLDSSKISGKNLLTGQKVTLESYLEKVKNSSKELATKSLKNVPHNTKIKNEHTALSNLLNKKLTIGKTLNGQRLIGKVIHVGKKDDNQKKTVIEDQLGYYINEINALDGSCVDLSASYYNSVANDIPNSVIIGEDNQTDENVLMNNINEMLVLDKTENVSETIEISTYPTEQECAKEKISQDMLDYVTKIMTDMMEMESVLKKLKRKNLLIKVVEKVVKENEVYINSHQIGGHLEMLGGWRKKEYEEKWIFKLDFEKKSEENGDSSELWPRKFPETVSLSMYIVKMDGLIHSTKVNLNYSLEKCSMCSKSFRSIHKLKTHMKLSHNADYRHKCKVCNQFVDSGDIYSHHRLHFVESNREHEQSPPENTQKLCVDSLKMNCTAFGRNRSNDAETFEKSREIKNCYVCKVCNRNFSRYSNLQRHSEIHGTKNSMALYSCSMCGCTYNYISSLTRHIVQNHISAS